MVLFSKQVFTTEFTFHHVGLTIIGFALLFLPLDSTNPNPQPPGNGCEEVDTGNLDHCTAVCISTVNSSTDLIETCVSACLVCSNIVMWVTNPCRDDSVGLLKPGSVANAVMDSP